MILYLYGLFFVFLQFEWINWFKSNRIALGFFTFSFSILCILDAISYYVIDWRVGFGSQIEYGLLFLYLVFYLLIRFLASLRLGLSFDVKFESIIQSRHIFLAYLIVLMYLLQGRSESNLVMLLGFYPKTLLFIAFYLLGTKRLGLIDFIIYLPMFFVIDESSRRFYIIISLAFIVGRLKYNSFKGMTILETIKRLSGVIFLSFILLNALRSTHDFGTGYKEGDLIANTWEYIISLKSLDTYWNTMFVMKHYNYENYLMGSSFLSGFLVLLPRALWASKPSSFASILGYNVRENDFDFSLEKWEAINKFSLSPGLLGEVYANFGLLGFLPWFLILGLIINFVDTNWVTNKFGVLSVLNLCFLVLITRGDFFSAVNFLNYLIFWIIIIKLVSFAR